MALAFASGRAFGQGFQGTDRPPPCEALHHFVKKTQWHQGTKIQAPMNIFAPLRLCAFFTFF
jgi:hypothetical protein